MAPLVLVGRLNLNTGILVASTVLVGQLNLDTGSFGGLYSSSGAAKPKHGYFWWPL